MEVVTLIYKYDYSHYENNFNIKVRSLLNFSIENFSCCWESYVISAITVHMRLTRSEGGKNQQGSRRNCWRSSVHLQCVVERLSTGWQSGTGNCQTRPGSRNKENTGRRSGSRRCLDDYRQEAGPIQVALCAMESAWSPATDQGGVWHRHAYSNGR